MLPGLSRANWLSEKQKKKKLQCSFVNCFSLRKAVKMGRLVFNVTINRFCVLFDLLGLINWFAVHPTSMNNTNHLISGDNKGKASQMFEKMMNGKDVRTGKVKGERIWIWLEPKAKHCIFFANPASFLGYIWGQWLPCFTAPGSELHNNSGCLFCRVSLWLLLPRPTLVMCLPTWRALTALTPVSPATSSTQLAMEEQNCVGQPDPER